MLFNPNGAGECENRDLKKKFIDFFYFIRNFQKIFCFGLVFHSVFWWCRSAPRTEATSKSPALLGLMLLMIFFYSFYFQVVFLPTWILVQIFFVIAFVQPASMAYNERYLSKL